MPYCKYNLIYYTGNAYDFNGNTEHTNKLLYSKVFQFYNPVVNE